jgi:NADH-quinone oxidoreductase subunit K
MMISVTPQHVLSLNMVLFALGFVGLFLNTRNLLRMLFCVELILLSTILNFSLFAYLWRTIDGHTMILFAIAVAATESVVGLSILILYFRSRESLSFQDPPLLKG